ncbi:MAG: hypothetical protein JXR96_27590 [Deltaproteobacteria bacterium]|nr:hypothetical protein [Deltaproteobacteria bacterium]
MARLLLHVFVCALVLSPRVGLAGDFKKSQYYRGIASSYAISSVQKADIDGDGRDEALVCYREPDEAIGQQGGVLVLAEAGDRFVVAWHAVFEGVYPEKVKVADRLFEFRLVQVGQEGKRRIDKTLVRGKDFFLRSDPKSPFYGVKFTASSSLKQPGIDAANVFDRDLKTVWAEGAEGTGVDESIELRFAKPIDLGSIGVLHGDFRGRRFWQDSNRIHRAEVTAETEADRYDDESGVDFEEDLGLGLYGDRVELSFTNRPIMRYFKLHKHNVRSLELKITSVLLGEKNDDTYISEIDLAELIPASAILGSKAGKRKTPEKGATTRPAEESDDDWTDDDF